MHLQQFIADKCYKYDKAKEELRRRDTEVSSITKVLKRHEGCKRQAQEKFPTPRALIEQVHFCRSCTDFWVAQLCSTKIMLPASRVGSVLLLVVARPNECRSLGSGLDTS